jgi:curved DNA-binding protein CbpA
VPDADNDLYALLEVCPWAGAPEIRRAYRRLARQHHPDHNEAPGSAARFRALSDAYATLSDPVRRARYDRANSVASRESVATRESARASEPPPVAQRGTLELSAHEAQLAAARPLRLVFRNALAITLPAGTRDGDQVLVNTAGRTIVLTVCVRS